MFGLFKNNKTGLSKLLAGKSAEEAINGESNLPEDIERLVIMAVARNANSIFIAGITHRDDKWLRPVKEPGALQLRDITFRDKSIMKPFDVVEFKLKKAVPREPHIEDWVCDFDLERPEKAGRLEDERYIFLDRHVDPKSPQQLINGEASLGLIKPSHIKAYFHRDSYSGRYEYKMWIPEFGSKLLNVCDIKWRALGRELLIGRDNFSADLADLQKLLLTKHIFIVLGLGCMHEGKCLPIVVGVHTWPDYNARIDYCNL